jgi:xanthine phosphoribosyltransferase
MQQLKDRILQENRAHDEQVLKVDSFLNHQIDPDMMLDIGRELAGLFQGVQPTRILTVETSGIAPAFATAAALHIPLVIARKRRVAGMPHDLLRESTISHSINQIVEFFVSPEFITPQDRVVIVDAFMTSGQTLLALARLALRGKATVVGIGTIIEKQYEQGRKKLEMLGVPIESLVKIREMGSGTIRFDDD